MNEIVQSIFKNQIHKLPVKKQVVFGFTISIGFITLLAIIVISLLNSIHDKESDVLHSFELANSIEKAKYNLLKEQFIVMELLESDQEFQLKDWKKEHTIAEKELSNSLHIIHKITSEEEWGNDFKNKKKQISHTSLKIENLYRYTLSPLINQLIATTDLKIRLIKKGAQKSNKYTLQINKGATLDTDFDYKTQSVSNILASLNKEINSMVLLSNKATNKMSLYANFAIWILGISSILIAIYFSKSIVSRLQKILGEDPILVANIVDQVTKGNVIDVIENKNATGLLKSVILMVEGIKEKVSFANEIGKGNFENQLKLSSKNDQLGNSLLTMAENLKKYDLNIKSLTNFQKSILDSTEYGIISTNLDGIITNFNKGAEKMLGYTAEEIVGIKNPAIFHDLDEIIQKSKELSIELNTNIEPGFEVFISKVTRFGLDKNEWTYIRKDGTRYPIELSIQPIFDLENNIIGFTGVSKDITEDKKKLDEILFLKEKTENLSKNKDEFMSNMSHEIRTPLSGILGFTNILLDDASLNEAQHHQLQAIKTSGDILLVIINDILDIAKIEAGKMSIEEKPVDLKKVTEHIVETFEVKIIEKEIKVNLKFSNDLPENVLSDSVRISQILLNLISNAIKFTPHKGVILIDVKLLKEDSITKYIKFTVQDSGIGIPKNKLDSIFDAFVQTSDDTTRKYGGTGLGLTIVKKIIDLMHGEVMVESEFGSGSKFTVILPLKKIDSINSINSETKTKTKTKKDLINSIKNIKILLAEDNLINQLLAQTILTQFEVQVTTVDNGLEAIEAVKSNNFDIILMDLMMPEMNGYDASKAIRELDDVTKNNIPIIALTADVTNLVIEKCKSVGINEYISKPFDSFQLKTKIQNLVK